MALSKVESKSQTPTFWRLNERTTAIQVHTAAEAELVRKHFEGRCTAFSVQGERLEVFHIRRSLEMGDSWIMRIFPNARRVWGSDGDNDNLPAQ